MSNRLRARGATLVCCAVLIISVQLSSGIAGQAQDYLFALFTGNGEDGLHFARST